MAWRAGIRTDAGPDRGRRICSGLVGEALLAGCPHLAPILGIEGRKCWPGLIDNRLEMVESVRRTNVARRAA